MEVRVSLGDVTKYMHIISKKTESPSTSCVMVEVVLGYRVCGLRREAKDLQIGRDNFRNEVNDLRAQYNYLVTCSVLP